MFCAQDQSALSDQIRSVLSGFVLLVVVQYCKDLFCNISQQQQLVLTIMIIRKTNKLKTTTNTTNNYNDNRVIMDRGSSNRLHLYHSAFT